MKRELTAFFDEVRPAVDASLDRLLPPADVPPPQIHEAMRYSVFAGGKRLRPALCVSGFRVFQTAWEPVLPVASAIEMVHTYSLIHDDLPSMDDDDFRRGRPSCHKRFGEAIAILAGDGLLTFAFETLASSAGFSPERAAAALVLLARAAGTQHGMIAGQVLDLSSQGCSIQPEQVESIHRLKTGALLAASVRIGAYLAGAPERDLALVTEYGERIGLAFQIVDDILDETATPESLGKTAGKDRRQQKVTYPSVYGLDRSRQIVRQVIEEARAISAGLGPGGRILADIAEFVEARSN